MWLEKVPNIFSQNGGLRVMNPRVESIKYHLKNKSKINLGKHGVIIWIQHIQPKKSTSFQEISSKLHWHFSIPSKMGPFGWSLRRGVTKTDNNQLCVDMQMWKNTIIALFCVNLLHISTNTVDGRNPAPPVTYETLWKMGYSHSPYQLVSRIPSINSTWNVLKPRSKFPDYLDVPGS